jgi:hypothetical protein
LTRYILGTLSSHMEESIYMWQPLLCVCVSLPWGSARDSLAHWSNEIRHARTTAAVLGTAPPNKQNTHTHRERERERETILLLTLYPAAQHLYKREKERRASLIFFSLSWIYLFQKILAPFSSVVSSYFYSLGLSFCAAFLLRVF